MFDFSPEVRLLSVVLLGPVVALTGLAHVALVFVVRLRKPLLTWIFTAACALLAVGTLLSALPHLGENAAMFAGIKVIAFCALISLVADLVLLISRFRWRPVALATSSLLLVAVTYLGFQIIERMRVSNQTPQSNDSIPTKLFKTHSFDCDAWGPDSGHCPDPVEFNRDILGFKPLAHWKRFPAHLIGEWNKSHLVLLRSPDLPAEIAKVDRNLFSACFMSHEGTNLPKYASQHLDRYCVCNSGSTVDLHGFSCEGVMGFTPSAGGELPKPGEVIGTIEKTDARTFKLKIEVGDATSPNRFVEAVIYRGAGGRESEQTVKFDSVAKRYPDLGPYQTTPFAAF